MNQTKAPSASPFFYGWWIVGISTLAMLVTNGLSIGGLAVFFKPILTELQIKDPSVIAGAAGLTFLISGLLAPFVGGLIGRINLRALMTFGCCCLGIGLFVYSRASSKSGIYAAHALLGLTLACASLIPNTVLVSNWFNRMRGTAMGIVITGTSLGTILIPVIAVPMILNYGWRTTMLALSSVVWIVLIPAIWLVVRVHPHEIGIGPDGDALATKPASSGVKSPIALLPGLTLGEALRTPMFYVFSICAAMLFYSILAVVQQLSLYLQSPRIGMTLPDAGRIQSTLGATSILGKLAFGWLSDRFPKVWVNLACCALLCAAAGLLLTLSASTAYAFAIPFGLGYGGAFVLVQLMVAECFGLRELGRILGVITVVETVGGALGNFLTGKLAAAAGNDYSVGFYGVFAASIIAVLSALLLTRLMPKAKPATG